VARQNYFNKGDHFSEFHRKFDGLSMIDIDGIEICKECSEPLAVFETAFDKGQTYKTTTVTEKVAIALKVPGLLIFYKVGEYDQIESFRVTKLTPTRGKEFILKPMDFIKYLQKLQSDHVCGVPF